jgi:malate synthase
MTSTEIPYYLDYLPKSLLDRLQTESESVDGVDGLRVATGLQKSFPTIETGEALQFVCELYQSVRQRLNEVLSQRAIDRQFIDEQTAECAQQNSNCDYLSPEYRTVVGQADGSGRVVVGPASSPAKVPPVRVPEFLEGFQVTLFGPPDTAKMAINAMNALNRRSPDEPVIVTELVEASGMVPRWGADNEDSKTPVMKNFLSACQNLVGCFDGSLSFDDPNNGKSYRLDETGRSIPIKRIPGLALPDGSHLLHENPLPLHLFDFAMHLFHNWQRPEALMFYIPKLENEFEAGYLKEMIELAEKKIQSIHPEYELGTVRLFIVFENPRAIFRIREIAAELAPYFLGGSLGWHDFLGSTARLFKNDPNYRIPVKADPNIVINHIRESHHLLVDALAPSGAIRIGGMYGVLYEDNNPESYQVSMVGYIKDVVTQLKRGLTGFWVAHPAFVRPGIALVEAFQRRGKDSNDGSMARLVRALVPDESESGPLLEFIDATDVPGLEKGDPLYQRGVLAASIATSDVIANDDPEEVRYNVFQALQYITDWLCGNGCVALPATMNNAKGEKVFVRIMDDLATTERSRWELWAEVNHGRVSVESFDEIVAEEMAFLKNNQSTDTKRPQVIWAGDAARWYPIAARLLRQLVVSETPVEFATELLMPFTFDVVRESKDPWAKVNELCPGKYA